MQYTKFILATVALAASASAQEAPVVNGCADAAILTPVLTEGITCFSADSDVAILNCLCTGNFKPAYDAAYNCAATANGGTPDADTQAGKAQFEQACATNNPALIGIPSDVTPLNSITAIPSDLLPTSGLPGGVIPSATGVITATSAVAVVTTTAPAPSRALSTAPAPTTTAATQGSGAEKIMWGLGGAAAAVVAGAAALL
ncbi:hypothetical protein HK097_007028 [Rhizophlyctis rosea]|uniref:Extracellular membrane protein CFEM domain-containing protein n=1 Tax=Rhizophlyctis rosea TaxID=64517 RepID=A0AAD5SLX2_9FUNG|nr:hypothetical protein HK097_007028 [Rhizophlyctis rosea]